MNSSNNEGEKRTSLDPGVFNCEFGPNSATAEYKMAIDEAAKHVKASRVMRTYANTRMAEALEDEQKEVAWAKRRDCCRSLGKPSLAKLTTFHFVLFVALALPTLDYPGIS